MEYAKKLLAQVGLEAERLQMLNLSAAMGQRFAEAATAMHVKIVALGPSPLRRAVTEVVEEKNL